MTRRMTVGLVVGMILLGSAAGEALGDGFIVIDRPEPRPILPPHPPRPQPRDVPLAVKSHQVTCDITDGVAVTRIDQVFRNPNAWQLEGTYIFPLDDDIALSGFSMFVDGNEIKGEVLDRDEARRIYESIVARMRDPALLEYMGTRMYKARIFPIPASGEVRVKLEYSQVLTIDGGLVRYRYPLNTEKFSSKPLEQVSVLVNIASAEPIKSVFCPTHGMSVGRESDNRASASFEAANVKPDTDLVLYYTLGREDFGLALLTYREPGNDGFFLARIAPRVALDAGDVVPKDVCFVLDTSGSMAGAKIEQAKKALKYCLHNLNAADRFQVVTFAHESSAFAEGLTETNAGTVAKAVEFVDRIRAEGGTNINQALLTALKANAAAAQPDRPYLIVFLTDGQPTIGEVEPNKILGNVKAANAGGVRLFVFGIGNDVNTKLLDRLAEENRGARDYIGDNEDLEIKVSSFYRKVANPVLANLQLTFPGLSTHDVFPQQLPDLFAGGEVVVVGRYAGSGSQALELTGERRGTRERHVYESRFAEADTQHAFLPRLWAMRKIGFLLDEIRLHGESKELVDAVAQLAIQYGVVTPYTAYLVHEQQKVTVDPRAGGRLLSQMVQKAAAEAGPGAAERGQIAVGPDFDRARTKAGGRANVADSSDALALREAPQAATPTRVAEALNVPTDTGERVYPIRQVGNRTFYLNGNVWTDAEYVERTETRQIKAFSEDYFALAQRDRRAAQFMALGERVIFLLDGQAYEVVPAD